MYSAFQILYWSKCADYAHNKYNTITMNVNAIFKQTFLKIQFILEKQHKKIGFYVSFVAYTPIFFK